MAAGAEHMQTYANLELLQTQNSASDYSQTGNFNSNCKQLGQICEQAQQCSFPATRVWRQHISPAHPLHALLLA
jgi:flagellar biosynthesis/type III secretory pathway chaperone